MPDEPTTRDLVQAVRRGIEAFNRREDWLGAYEDFDQVIEEYRDLGDGVTLGVFLQRARPAGSSGHVQLRYASVGTWKGGLVERATIYADIDQARAVAERLAEERG